MVRRLEWLPANDGDNSALPMYKAIGDILKNFEPQFCHICMREKIRFYYTVSDFQPDFVVTKGQVRGTVWVWCANCLYWIHGSGINLSKNIIYVNKLDESELKQVKGPYMIDNLNRLWDKGRLAQSFTIL
jgi:hypothetical protein